MILVSRNAEIRRKLVNTAPQVYIKAWYGRKYRLYLPSHLHLHTARSVTPKPETAPICLRLTTRRSRRVSSLESLPTDSSPKQAREAEQAGRTAQAKYLWDMYELGNKLMAEDDAARTEGSANSQHAPLSYQSGETDFNDDQTHKADTIAASSVSNKTQ